MNIFKRFLRRRKFTKKEYSTKCEYIECCPCNPNKSSYNHCKNCVYYKWIDSGYGTCIALPKIEVVPWCKISCSLYKRK